MIFEYMYQEYYSENIKNTQIDVEKYPQILDEWDKHSLSMTLNEEETETKQRKKPYHLHC